MIKAIIFDFFGVILRDGGVDETLLSLAADLRKKHKTALLTNVSHLERYIDRSKLDAAFDLVAPSDEIGFGKPDARAYRYVLDGLGVKPEEALMIDDIPPYVAVAETMGMKGIVFDNPSQFKSDFQRYIEIS